MSEIQASADERLSLLSIWAQQHISSAVQRIEPASADASFRRYFRVTFKNGSLVAMDAPPQREPLGPFLDVAQRLRHAGVSAPEVLAVDIKRGFALLQDLGSTTYLDALRTADTAADALYGDAIHALVSMQTRAVADGLPEYDEALLRREMALFKDWLLEKYLGLSLSAADQRAWQATVDMLVHSALAQPRVFVHRDYHSRNLMCTEPGAPGVIDFQDAVYGPVTYDIVSLLKDCYIEWPRARIDRWWQQYLDLLAQTPLAGVAENPADLRSGFELMGIQRHLKASGIFARLHLRDGKDGYLEDIPRTLGYIRDADQPSTSLQWLRSLVVTRVLPALQAR